jgi:hypothetical protein
MANTPSIQTLRAEHKAQVIGPILKKLLERIVRATAPTYPSLEYSDAQVWNVEALEDALHGWVADRLLRRGDLAAMLLRASTTEHLRAMLTTSFGQFLTNRRPRTSASNLYTRTKKMLNAKFRAVGPSASRDADVLWTTEDGKEEPTGLSIRALVAIAHELDDETLEVVRYGPHSMKSSPILREPKLEEFLQHLLSRARGSVRLGQIAEVERCRFNLPAFEQVELDTALAADFSTVVSVERADLARSVLMRLDSELLTIVMSYAETDTVAAAAKKAEVSGALFSERMNQILAMIAEFADSPEEAAAVFRELLSLV